MKKNSQGENLKKSIAISDYSATFVADKLNISRVQLYNLYKLESIPDKYIKKLETLGLSLESIDIKDKVSSQSDQVLIKRLEMEIESQNDLISSLRETIEAKNEAIEAKNTIIETQKNQKKASH